MNGNTISIFLQNPVVQPGDKLIGHVDLIVASLLSSNGVELRISGKESWSWLEVWREGLMNSDEDNSSRNREISHAGGCVIFKLKHNLIEHGVIEPGNYRLPFTINVPTNLPGSLQFSEAVVRSCSVVYTVKAVVDIVGCDKSPLRCRELFTIVQPAEPDLIGIMASDNAELQSCCNIAEGRVNVSMETDKEFYRPGETLSVKATIGNNSSMSLEKVSLKLGYHLEFFYSPKHFATISGGYITKADFPCSSSNTAIYQLVIPPETHQQCFGYTIAMKYFVQLIVKVPCGTDICCTVPVAISENPNLSTNPHLLSNSEIWNLTEMAVADIPKPRQNPPKLALSRFPGSQNMHVRQTKIVSTPSTRGSDDDTPS